MSSLERRPNWSPVNSASGGSPTLGSSSMPPNTTDRRIQLFHALLFITKHQKSTNIRILLRSFRPPSLCCVLSAPFVLPSLSLAVCAQEKTRRKAKAALGKWRFRPIALPPYRVTDLSYRMRSVLHTYVLPIPSTCSSDRGQHCLLTFLALFKTFFLLSWELFFYFNAIFIGGKKEAN